MVMQLPERDELSQTREQLHAQLAMQWEEELQKKLFW
jgi:hypothetical protein